MASTLEKIKTLLSKSKEQKMYAEMILDDGRVLATEDEQFMIGSVVMVVGDDGETSKLAAGTYTMSDGAKLTIDDNSKIVDLGEEKEAEGVEKPEEMQEEKEEEIDEEKLSKAIYEATPDKVSEDKAKEMAKKVKKYAEEEEEEDKEEMASEAEDTDWAKTFEEMKDRVAALEKEVFGDKAEEETEDLSKEKVEMSKDMVNSLVEEIEHLKAKVVELEKEPGTEGFTHNPENDTKSEKTDLGKMSINDRVKYLINN
jgi:hypothetical protein